MARGLPLYFKIAALVAAIIFFIPSAEGCFIPKSDIKDTGSQWVRDRYDSSNWEREDNIFNPKNFDFCKASGWC